MKKILLSIFALLLVCQLGFSQHIQLSPDAEISIITVGPGKVLYEGFGHSTIRIKDKNHNIDLAYNYGIFDFNSSNFYINFTKGKLLYKLARYPFHYFVDSYKQNKRWIKEQILNLTIKEKQQFFIYLENNAKPKNATYLYDPFFDNCSTKMVSITKIILGDKVTFLYNHLTKNLSFRQLMNREILWNTWGSFGINLALGSKLDKKATANQYNYLPDYVFSAFNNALLNKKNNINKLVKKEQFILQFKEIKQSISIFNPLFILSLISLIGLFITFKDIKNKQRTKWLDFIVFFSTGLIGSLIVFLWFFTSHSTAPNNFNFLWSFAPNLVVAFYIVKNNLKKWLKKYIQFILILLLSIPFIWIGGIQLLPTAIIPLLILLSVRYWALIKLLKVKN